MSNRHSWAVGSLSETTHPRMHARTLMLLLAVHGASAFLIPVARPLALRGYVQGPASCVTDTYRPVRVFRPLFKK